MQTFSRFLERVSAWIGAIALLLVITAANAWMTSKPGRVSVTWAAGAAVAASTVLWFLSGWFCRWAQLEANEERLDASLQPYTEVYERFTWRMLQALLLLAGIGGLAGFAYAKGDPGAVPLGTLAAGAALRLSWLIWRRFTAALLLATTSDGLILRDVGRVEWRDLIGFCIREEQWRWRTRRYLDFCIRRPDRYDLAVTCRTPGREGFAVGTQHLDWADATAGHIDAAIRHARRRVSAPFVESWSLDMTGAEIHAELDVEDLALDPHGIVARLPPGSIHAEVADVASRLPDALARRTTARTARRHRLARRAVVCTLGAVVLVLVDVALRWWG